MKMNTKLLLFVVSGVMSGASVFAQHVWKSVNTGDASTYAIRDDGSLWACGWNEKGQLGNGIKERTSFFTCVGTDKNWKMVSSGKAYTFFLKEDGSLWAAGTSESGVQGTGDGRDHDVPTRIGTDNDWAYVTAPRFWAYNGFAIKSDGSLWGWGENTAGQLGIGNFQNQLVPVRIGEDNDWVSVTCGQGHVLALKSDGSMWGWGSNISSALGIDQIECKIPVRIGTDTDWEQVVAIGTRSYAVKKDGTLWGCGGNGKNILGLNLPLEEDESSVIREFTRITAVPEKVVCISGCESTTIVGTGENGKITKVYAWGSNGDGALGDGNGRSIVGSTDIPFASVPVSPKLKDMVYTQLSSGQSYTMILSENGTLFGWGRNRGGQLGDQTDYDQLQVSYYKKPVEIECPQDEVGSGVSGQEIGLPVSFDGTWLNIRTGGLKEVKIYAVNGTMVRTLPLTRNTWNLADLTPGIYLVKYRTDGISSAYKFVKK